MTEARFTERRDVLPLHSAVDGGSRAAQKNQHAACIWLTGLSGAGKSTIARTLDEQLFAAERHAFILDGDDVRRGLNRDLGFDLAARTENVRRIAEVARLMVDAGLIAIVAVISPMADQRAFARSLFAPHEFIEVFVDTPLEECVRRDPKGLYARAMRGEITDLTGVHCAYERPERSDVVVRPTHLPTDGADLIVRRLATAAAGAAAR